MSCSEVRPHFMLLHGSLTNLGNCYLGVYAGLIFLGSNSICDSNIITFVTTIASGASCQVRLAKPRLFGPGLQQSKEKNDRRAMGCTSSCGVSGPREASHPPNEADGMSSVTWRDFEGRTLSEEVSISRIEPSLSFHSMEDIDIQKEERKYFPPMKRTHVGHVMRFDRFLDSVDEEKLSKAVHHKRMVHGQKQKIRWSQETQVPEVPGAAVVVSA